MERSPSEQLSLQFLHREIPFEIAHFPPQQIVSNAPGKDLLLSAVAMQFFLWLHTRSVKRSAINQTHTAVHKSTLLIFVIRFPTHIQPAVLLPRPDSKNLHT